ncbi:MULTISPECIES: acyl-CoA dehydrogenase family protein [Methylorubrum]|jgi:alkylation response protein AidB-like acyl-CoA dehydrogenase|uniref:Acyl-CoA dehydrogenase domain-containing protein n=1 Tax=Methylorubrum extorquens DSM 13060 TaxID=882800 RepID=H1KHK2_METEX|nr:MULTISPECIES: acyl-CoA dehydrogenase family protein [Methylorubrum]EHP93001.1 acyl-CoA dehydrogenase domain-containing protein [Methylorubrum extorquens DSM 13060]BDL38418.1 acyl-CoA dehydrogenase [Methylorubrum sp. GM97]
MSSALALRPADDSVGPVPPATPNRPDWTDEAVLAGTKAIADGPLSAAAAEIDRGAYPLEILGRLGGVGALAVHLDRHGGRFGLSVAAMQAASRACGATGFLMWCHDVCGLYLEQSGNAALTGAVLDDHAAGRSFGGTALSNPMKAFAGIEPILLRARRVPGGYRVSGMLPWVSHIGPGQYCGAIAGVVGANDTISHEIMFVLACDRAELRPCPHFSGMEGTSTWGVRLDDLFVGHDDLIADPARPFIGRIRGAFILLQCGMGLGVAEGSLDAMLAVEETLGHVNQFLDDRPDAIAAELTELRARVMRLAETPFDGSTDYLIDVLDARTQVSELALRASQSSLLHQGARGYLMSAAPQRRIREAHFVAIVTPAIKHLRWEMARLSRETLPTVTEGSRA